MPFFSVILPNYNHSIFLEKRLQSILNQTFQDFELIILDDNSTDESQKILEKFRSHPKVSHFELNTINSGSPFSQWKKGITFANGSYIWIAESDDFADVNFLTIAYNTIINEKAELFFTQSYAINTNGTILNDYLWFYETIPEYNWKNKIKEESIAFIKNAMLKKNVLINASAVVFRNDPYIKNALDKVDKFKFCGDYYFWTKYLMKVQSVYFEPTPLNYFRQHAHTTRYKGDNLSNIIRFLELYTVKKYILETFRPLNYKKDIELELVHSMNYVTIGYVWKWLLVAVHLENNPFEILKKYFHFRLSRYLKKKLLNNLLSSNRQF